MYSRHDPNEYYVWRLKTKRSINQVWARVNGFAKSPFSLFNVIPAKAGIQEGQHFIDSRLRGNDGFSDFLLVRQI